MPVAKDLSAYPQRIELDIELGYSADYPNSAFFAFDFDVQAIFGSKGRVPVKLSVDGHSFRSSLVPMGGTHMMVFNKQMRDATGYKAGDRIHILLERDSEPRKVDIPGDVKAVLEEQGVWDAFQKFSYSHQKEDIAWINEAKKPETRSRRIAKLADKLLNQS